MEKHEILSTKSRAALFDERTDEAAIVSGYKFWRED